MAVHAICIFVNLYREVFSSNTGGINHVMSIFEVLLVFNYIKITIEAAN